MLCLRQPEGGVSFCLSPKALFVATFFGFIEANTGLGEDSRYVNSVASSEIVHWPQAFFLKTTVRPEVRKFLFFLFIFFSSAVTAKRSCNYSGQMFGFD